MGKGKPSIAVDQKKLLLVIQEIESSGPLANRSALFNEVAAKYNASEFVKVTPAVVGLRVKQWGVKLVTPLGKKGRGKGVPMTDAHKAAMLAGRGQRKSKSEKFSSNPEIVSFFSELKARTPERFHNLVESAQNGSRTAASKLHCLECSGYDNKNVTDLVRHCPCNGADGASACPLWAFRPYQIGTAEVEEIETEELEAVA
jgi:hypothetical protein